MPDHRPGFKQCQRRRRVLMSFKTKWMIAAIPVTMFGSMYVSYAFVAWPTVTALHSGASPLTAYLAATYTIIGGVGATFVGAHLAPKMTNIMKHHDRPSAPDPRTVGRLEPVPATVNV